MANSSNACPGVQTVRVPAGTYAITLTGRYEDNNRRGDLDLLDSMNIIGAGEAIYPWP